MSRTCEGPAPARKAGPPENATARKLLNIDATTPEYDLADSSPDRLRQLSRSVLDGPHADAADQAADWVNRGLLDRTTAATVLSVAGQAAGVGQTDALTAIRGAFTQQGVR